MWAGSVGYAVVFWAKAIRSLTWPMSYDVTAETVCGGLAGLFGEARSA